MNPAKEATAAKGIAWQVPLACQWCGETDITLQEVDGTILYCKVCSQRSIIQWDRSTKRPS